MYEMKELIKLFFFSKQKEQDRIRKSRQSSLVRSMDSENKNNLDAASVPLA